MILLRANTELRQTFEKLIQTMNVPVKWNGIFVTIDNYIILQGEVRSLFFHFDSRKVVTNIIDIPVKEEDVLETADNVWIQNVINMILYAFGKWGNIKGLRVEKDDMQLNRMFGDIMKDLLVEPDYTREYFRFYKQGIRITYEDVIQAALEAGEEAQAEEEEMSGGLWHKVVWRRAGAEFIQKEMSLREHRTGRLGNNFYPVGYLCPACQARMHIVVYPVGTEFRIETEEGGVLLARAFACDQCSSFYTPRPDKLLAEGDVYLLPFEGDRRAYEDYLELLGSKGEKVSNPNCNRFVDQKNQDTEQEQVNTEDLEEICGDLEHYSDETLEQILRRIEEGFYPRESVGKFEDKIRDFLEERYKSRELYEVQNPDAGAVQEEMGSSAKDSKNGCGESSEDAAEEHAVSVGGRESKVFKESVGWKAGRTKKAEESDRKSASADFRKADRLNKESVKRDTAYTNQEESYKEQISEEESEAVCKRYEAKLSVLDRFSERQLKDLFQQLSKETKLPSDMRLKYLEQVEQKLNQEGARQLTQKADSCEGKSYVVTKRVLDEVERAALPADLKGSLIEKLKGWMQKQADREAAQLIQKMPLNLDRVGYKRFMERLSMYEGVDLSPYEEQLSRRREEAEKQELAGMINRARKNTRKDLKELSDRLLKGGFQPDLLTPYLSKIEEKIKKLDEEAIAEICKDLLHMTFDEGMDAYAQITNGEFLPELKADALKLLEKRLAKIKTDESELLVKKLREAFGEAGVKEYKRHHFYPARKVLMQQASPEETDVIYFAMASYAAGKGLFEYPILVADSSRNESGKEGMILTPDHLYYSTLLTAYGISVWEIDKITASTGFLNRGLYVHQRNGTKTKIPYVVESKELSALAEVLNEFVHYLQEKPDSRNLNYLAREKHETICCFRCGYTYKDGNICPKCGFKSNE